MKRFVDTELWRKEWYRKLTPAEKSAWAYLVSNCDNVGVLRLDRELADYMIGEPVDWNALPQKVNGNLELLPSGKLWIVDFCEFQYGELYSNCKPHASYIALLEKHSLLCFFKRTNKGFGYPIDRVQDKKKTRKGLDMDKEKEEEEHRVEEDLEKLHKKFGRVK